MGVLPCQFKEGVSAQTLNLDGTETFEITGLEASDSGSQNVEVRPRQDVTLTIHRADGSTEQVPVILRIDTPIEIDYYLHGGILPYVLRQLLAGTTGF
jgi:aconitate hydratase